MKYLLSSALVALFFVPSASGFSIGQHIAQHAALGLSKAHIPTAISLAGYGVVCDGSTDISDEVQAAVDAEGQGAYFIFPESASGSECIINKAVVPVSAQSFDCMGGRLKHGAMPSTTIAVGETFTAGDCSGSSCTLEVTDTTGFEVGMWIAIEGAGAADDHTINKHVITAISAPDITFTGVYETGSDDFTAGDVFAATASFFSDQSATAADDFTLRNCTLDGNRDNNTSALYWEIWNEVHVHGDRTRIEYVHFTDSPVEAIYPFGGENSSIDHVWFTDIGHHAIHSSSCSNCSVTNWWVDGANLTELYDAPTFLPGHGNCAFSFSAASPNMRFVNYTINDASGGICNADADDAGLRSENGRIENCSPYPIHFSTASTDVIYDKIAFKERVAQTVTSNVTAASPAVLTVDDASGHGIYPDDSVTLAGFTCTPGTLDGAQTATPLSKTTFSVPVDCSGGVSDGTGTVTRASTTQIAINGGDQVKIINSTFDDVTIKLAGSSTDIDLLNNTFSNLDIATTGHYLVQSNSTDGLRINGHFEGGRRGIYLQGASSKNTDISGTFKNQGEAGLYFENSVPDKANINVHDYTVIAESGAILATYYGIYARAGVVLDSGHFYLGAGDYCIDADANADYLRVINNVVDLASLDGAATHCIDTSGDTTIIKNNTLNDGTINIIAGTGSLVLGNLLGSGLTVGDSGTSTLECDNCDVAGTCAANDGGCP